MSKQPTRDHAGFTLVEMMIVVLVIAILAGTAVPNLLSGRSTANERTVIATLRSIASAQAQMKNMAAIDIDLDGTGEYGGLGEMSGTVTLRAGTETLEPNLLSVGLGGLDALGRVRRNGYYIALFLPDAAGIGIADLPGNAGSIDPTHAEEYWSCVAWPQNRGNTGKPTYFVNQMGEIMMAAQASYSGTANVPPPGAALLGGAPNRIDSQQLALNTIGADGNQWIPVN